MNRKKILFPMIVMVVCGLLTVSLIKFGRRAQPVPPESSVPVVEVWKVTLSPREFEVMSQGTVRASTSIPLISELDGVVTEVASGFQQGDFFTQGDVLLQLDPTDYEALVAQASSQLASARLKLERIQAESKLAREDWESLSEQFSEGATPLLLMEPQLNESETALRAAEASLAKARKDLERTEIRAPFDGRILQKSVDRGQFVRRGQELARIFDISKVEVALPVAVSELAFLDPRLGVPGPPHSGQSIPVILAAEYAGQQHEWTGEIRRTTGGLDDRSRMISLVAEVQDPFGLRRKDVSLAPLQVGAFVKARIQGVKRDRTFMVPRSAIVDETKVLLVDPENRIRRREVEVIRYAGESAIIASGLNPNELVCVSTLEIPMEGSKVDPVITHNEGNR